MLRVRHRPLIPDMWPAHCIVGFGTPLTEAVGRFGSLVPVEEPLLAIVKREDIE